MSQNEVQIAVETNPNPSTSVRTRALRFHEFTSSSSARIFGCPGDTEMVEIRKAVSKVSPAAVAPTPSDPSVPLSETIQGPHPVFGFMFDSVRYRVE